MATYRRVVATLVMAAAVVGAPLGTEAGASPSSNPPAPSSASSPTHRSPFATAVKPATRVFAGSAARLAPLAGVRAAGRVTTVQSGSLNGPAPACYGDSRTISSQGAELNPSTYGAYFNCADQEWTFEVGTSAPFSSGQFGAWFVDINFDGNPNGGCNGTEYQAVVYQSTSAPGTFYGSLDEFMSCTYSFSTGNPTMTLTSTGVALTFPWTDIDSEASIAWAGGLYDYAEWQGNTNYATVPSSTFVDDGVEGSVLDSVPPPQPVTCNAANSTGAEVAVTSNSARAATVLRQASFARVHDYGQGVVSFAGNPATARAKLAAAGLAARVSPDQMRYTQSIAGSGTTTPPNDPSYGSQWNLAAVNAPGAWAVTTGNPASPVVVADIDTGVDFQQSDLQSPQLIAGVDETTSPPTPINYASGNTDTNGHGTAVAGVIAAQTNNNNEVASLGWNTSVMPVKASTDGTFTTAAIAAGINYAVANGAKVINLSLGGPCPDSTEETAVESAISHGVVVVAAAGNGALSSGLDPQDGEGDSPMYPADYPGVIAVGATAQDGYRAAYSNTGSYVGMVAPGGGFNTSSDCITVLSNQPTGTACEGGTSFAAPQVAAAAALVLSVNPSLTVSQVTELLESTATATGPGDNNIEYGHGLLDAAAAVADTPPTTSGYGEYTSLPPARILDTRTGIGGSPGALGPNATMQLQVTGAGGVPSTGVSAVVVNVTVTEPTAPSFLTVYPDGQSLPNSSNINFVANQTIANLVTVKVGNGGYIDIHNQFGDTQVVVDVAGYYGDGTGPAGSTYVPLAPYRLLDTRQSGEGGPLGPGEVRNLTVTGVDSVPANAAGVVLNVTVTEGSQPSFLTVYPSGEGTPNASNVNFVANQTIANLATVQVGSGGQIAIHNQFGTVQVVVDLQGYFTAPGVTSGSRFFPVVDHRILDTRYNIGGFYTPVGPKSSITVGVVGHGGVLDGAAAAVLNGTATGGTAPSFLTFYPSGSTPPNASNVNFVANQTIANLASSDLSSGDLRVYNSAGNVNVVADVAGWYGAPGT
jgi:subtilisin family serine protease